MFKPNRIKRHLETARPFLCSLFDRIQCGIGLLLHFKTNKKKKHEKKKEKKRNLYKIYIY